jgi:tRNA (guanine6-N2)-methyltransferase
LRIYYSTFVPGLLEPVEEALRSDLPDSRILLALDGLAMYESSAKADVIEKLSFVTNSFYLLKHFEGSDLATMAAAIVKERFEMPLALPRGKTFRVITSVSNQLVAVDNSILEALERRITENTGLRSHRSKPDYEFWLALRSEGHGFFSLRLSHHKAYDKILRKGELRPELANILCRLSDPKPKELFLDPFCGSGAIPIQRATAFAEGLVIASDQDESLVELLRDRIKDLGLKKRVVVRCDDALHLTRYQDGSIHTIVTDPPWGHFVKTDAPIADFYRDMLEELVRVLRPDGRLVILTAETAAMDAAVKQFDRLALSRKFNILLSGKKASVYVFLRR